MSATFSLCGAYRYTLRRFFHSGRCDRGVLFVMLNPSTADAEQDDPTIRRCIGFAKREGFDRLDVVNLFAFRATKPAELAAAKEPIGDDNDRRIYMFTRQADLIVAAWGAHPFAGERAEQVKAMWARMDLEVHCLGLNLNGSPRHPLYVKGDQPLERFPLGVIA